MATNNTQTMEQHSNTVQLFGLIVLPSNKYVVERNILVNLIGILSALSIIANAILIFVIVKDPFKQLRTITAMLLTFNSSATVIVSLLLLVDSILRWSNHNAVDFLSKLSIGLGSCSLSWYIFANILHTVNIFSTTVFPLRYSYLSTKALKLLPCILFIDFVLIASVILIPLYTLRNSKIPEYVEGVMSFLCAQLILLVILFVCLYAKIFHALISRKRTLRSTLNITRASKQGAKILKRNNAIAKTLFIHVVFFLVAAIPQTIAISISIYCTSCGTPEQVQLAILFLTPVFYLLYIFHPILWLYRLKSYNNALKQTFGVFGRRSTKIRAIDVPRRQTHMSLSTTPVNGRL